MGGVVHIEAIVGIAAKIIVSWRLQEYPIFMPKIYLVLITRIRNHYITKNALNTSNFILSIANIINVVPHALKGRFEKM